MSFQTTDMPETVHRLRKLSKMLKFHDWSVEFWNSLTEAERTECLAHWEDRCEQYKEYMQAQRASFMPTEQRVQ